MRHKKLFFKLKLSLIALLACTAVAAQADITVKVMKGGTAPYLYAYTGSGNDAVKHTGDWPGTQYTEKDADGYWTMTIAGVNSVNVVFNDGGSNQTSDILNVTGVDGTARFTYDGGSTWFGAIPSLGNNVGYIYFSCPPDWGNSTSNPPYVHFLNSNEQQLGSTGWPGYQMQSAGTDGAGFEIYKYYTADWNGISKLVFNCGSNAHQTGNLGYVANGYYNISGSQATVHALTSGNGYSDANFRAGIASQLGINDGDAFVPASVSYLDVSNCGITSLAGISNFTNLKTLIASNNSLTCTKTDRTKLNLSNNTNLEELNVNGNNGITSVDVAALTGLTHLEMNNCNINDDQTFAPAGSHNALTYLDMSDNSTEKGFSWHQYLPNLETLIVANANIKPTGFTQGTDYFSGMSKLKYLDVSHCPLITSIYLTGAPNLETLILNGNTNLQKATSSSSSDGKLIGLAGLTKLKHVEFTDVDLATATLISNLANSKSTLEYLDLSRATLFEPSLSGFTALKTFKASGNYNLPSGSSRFSLTTLTINNSPLLSSIDLTGDQGLVTLNLTNIGRDNSNSSGLFTGLTDCTALEMINLDGNNFTSVPAFGHDTYTSIKLNKNNLSSIDMSNADSGVRFLYAEENGLGGNVELTSTSVGQLKGLDLGNNGITSFKAEGTQLSALMIGGNPSMTTLELHGNDNLTCTTAGTTMSDGSGLYVKGNTALETIDLSNSSFNQIGANAALEGLTAVKTLNGSHNQFTTFTNSNFDNGDRLASYVAGKASLEHLTGLEHLDLSYNELADSVHLYRNTALRWLDVSHNNHIGPLATTEAEKQAMRLKKVDLLRKYHCKDTPIGISCSPATQATLDANEATTHRAFDLRDVDLRDTTGLFHLDLNYNTELRYLDISETNIHNTAAGWWYMNPGWEYGTGGWYSYVDKNNPGTKSPANGSTRHHFVWLQTCGKLEEFHADNNNMQSLGLRTSPYLHTITAKGMYGDCWLMRDASTSANPDNLTERGNISISGSVVTYSRTTYKTNTDGTLSGTVYYKDANGVEGGSNYYPNPVKWYDVSNSGYYAVRTNYGVNLEHLDVSGNHLSELKVSGNTKLQYVDTENNDLLTYVDANDLPDLTTLKVADNPVLEKLYADNDPSLPSITGLDDCTALKYLHVQNNGLFGSNGFNVEANTRLQSLLAYNCNLPGELKVSQCAAMDTLCCNDNQLTKLDVASLEQMHWLDCYNNTGITVLEPAASTGMTHLDLHNCSVLDLNVAPNTAMRYFDCDNNHIRELYFAGAANVETIHANSNNLFQLNLSGSHQALADLQFEHNHINGIDLTGCDPDVLTTLNDADNGRTVQANFAEVNHKELYYFQLEEIENAGRYLSDEPCTEDAAEPYGRGYTATLQPRTLVEDGFDSDRVTWIETFAGRRGARSDGYNLDPDQVMGTIVLLENTSTDPSMGSGTEVYEYDNGISKSSFYLNWFTQGKVVTAVDDLDAAQGLQITGGEGAITISTNAATAITVYDMSGRAVASVTLQPGDNTIDHLQPGIYLVNGQKVAVR